MPSLRRAWNSEVAVRRRDFDEPTDVSQANRGRKADKAAGDGATSSKAASDLKHADSIEPDAAASPRPGAEDVSDLARAAPEESPDDDGGMSQAGAAVLFPDAEAGRQIEKVDQEVQESRSSNSQEESAARKIQAVWRGYQGRKKGREYSAAVGGARTGGRHRRHGTMDSIMSESAPGPAPTGDWTRDVGLDALGMEAMKHILRRVHDWLTQKLPHLADELCPGDQEINPDSVPTAAACLWEGSLEEQELMLKDLYNTLVHYVPLGDWELGYAEDLKKLGPLYVVLDLCCVRQMRIPALPLTVLLQSLADPSTGRLHSARLFLTLHTLIRHFHRHLSGNGLAAEHTSADLVLWCLSSLVYIQQHPLDRQHAISLLNDWIRYTKANPLSAAGMTFILMALCIPPDPSGDVLAASSFVGRMTRATSELARESNDHVTLPELLYGLMLPAIFFVNRKPNQALLDTLVASGGVALLFKMLTARSVVPLSANIAGPGLAEIISCEERDEVQAMVKRAGKDLNNLVTVLRPIAILHLVYLPPSVQGLLPGLFTGPCISTTCRVMRNYMTAAVEAPTTINRVVLDDGGAQQATSSTSPRAEADDPVPSQDTPAASDNGADALEAGAREAGLSAHSTSTAEMSVVGSLRDGGRGTGEGRGGARRHGQVLAAVVDWGDVARIRGFFQRLLDLQPGMELWTLWRVVVARCVHPVLEWEGIGERLLHLATRPEVQMILEHAPYHDACAATLASATLAPLCPGQHRYFEMTGKRERLQLLVQELVQEASMAVLNPLHIAEVKGPLDDFQLIDAEESLPMPAAEAVQGLARHLVGKHAPASMQALALYQAQDHLAGLEAMSMGGTLLVSKAVVAFKGSHLPKDLVNKKRVDTVTVVIGSSLEFHALAYILEQASPYMKRRMAQVRNIYQDRIALPTAGDLDMDRMYSAFSAAMQFIYTGCIEALERRPSAMFALDVWMVSRMLEVDALSQLCEQIFPLALACAKRVETMRVADRMLSTVVRAPALFAALAGRHSFGAAAAHQQQMWLLALDNLLCRCMEMTSSKVMYRLFRKHGKLLEREISARLRDLVVLEVSADPDASGMEQQEAAERAAMQLAAAQPFGILGARTPESAGSRAGGEQEDGTGYDVAAWAMAASAESTAAGLEQDQIEDTEAPTGRSPSPQPATQDDVADTAQASVDELMRLGEQELQHARSVLESSLDRDIDLVTQELANLEAQAVAKD